jgi:superfamily I DNA/RNA helicase
MDIKSGNTTGLWPFMVDKLGLESFRNPESARFTNEVKNKFVSSLQDIPGARPNMFIERFLSTAQPMLGRTPEANLSVLELDDFIDDNPNLKLNSLNGLKLFLVSLKTKQIKEQLQLIQIYLMNLWGENNDNSKSYNMETREKDLLSLLSFMNKQSIEEFINNIHLNLEIDSIDDCLFLSTVHGSKGLEWEHVYIIDMDCKNFPNVRQSYYKDEIDNVMEERRLFYVAASRAKKYLCINFKQRC